MDMPDGILCDWDLAKKIKHGQPLGARQHGRSVSSNTSNKGFD